MRRETPFVNQTSWPYNRLSMVYAIDYWHHLLTLSPPPPYNHLSLTLSPTCQHRHAIEIRVVSDEPHFPTLAVLSIDHIAKVTYSGIIDILHPQEHPGDATTLATKPQASHF